MLRVRDLMSTGPDTARPGTPLRRVLAMMNTDGCRHVPVVEDGRLLGIVTERDIRLAVSSPHLDRESVDRLDALDELDAESCMTRDPETVSPEDSACAVADMMSLTKFGAYPVIEAGELLGMISAVDYLKHVASGDVRGSPPTG